MKYCMISNKVGRPNAVCTGLQYTVAIDKIIVKRHDAVCICLNIQLCKLFMQLDIHTE